MVYAYDGPTDLRKSFDTLAALVTSELQRDVLSGELFLFLSRDRQKAKVLFYDGTGLCLLCKRLARGRFAAPWKQSERPVRMTMTELTLLLEGCSLVGTIPLSPREIGVSPARLRFT